MAFVVIATQRVCERFRQVDHFNVSDGMPNGAEGDSINIEKTKAVLIAPESVLGSVGFHVENPTRSNPAQLCRKHSQQRPLHPAMDSVLSPHIKNNPPRELPGACPIRHIPRAIFTPQPNTPAPAVPGSHSA